MIKHLTRWIAGVYLSMAILTPWNALGKEIIIENPVKQKEDLENLSIGFFGNVPTNLPKKIEQLDPLYGKYGEFKYPDELPQISKHAKRIDVEPELLMAIRLSENGGDDSLAYGILLDERIRERYNNGKGYTLEGKFYLYTDEKEKQLCWAAWTIKKNFEKFEINSNGHKDFISYLASNYAPIGVKNDPSGLNQSWEKNVRFFYEKFKGLTL